MEYQAYDAIAYLIEFKLVLYRYTGCQKGHFNLKHYLYPKLPHKGTTDS